LQKLKQAVIYGEDSSSKFSIIVVIPIKNVFNIKTLFIKAFIKKIPQKIKKFSNKKFPLKKGKSSPKRKIVTKF
jgi:sugar-specific transcriptional regulator TrmB